MDTTSAQLSIDDLKLGEPVPQDVAPICCRTDMDLDTWSDRNDWTCLQCGAIASVLGGVVVELDR